MDRVQVAEVKTKWQVLVNTVIILGVLKVRLAVDLVRSELIC